MTLMVQMILMIQKTLMVLMAPTANPTMNPKTTQTVYSYMHYMTSQTACGTSVNPKQQNLRKSKSVNLILLMELTLRNSEISSCHATFISAIVLTSSLQTKKEFFSSYHTSKDQPLAGSNPVLTTQPIPHTGCGIIKRFSASLKTISVLTTPSEMPKNPFPNLS